MKKAPFTESGRSSLREFRALIRHEVEIELSRAPANIAGEIMEHLELEKPWVSFDAKTGRLYVAINSLFNSYMTWAAFEKINLMADYREELEGKAELLEKLAAKMRRKAKRTRKRTHE